MPSRFWKSFDKFDFIIFFSGFSVMLIEIIGARMLSIFFGNTLFVWTSIIGVIMASLSLGYYYGGIEGDRNPDSLGLSKIFLQSSVFTVIIPYTIMLGSLFQSFSLVWSPIVATIISLAIPAYHLGKITPYCIRIKAKSVKTIGKVSGKMYSISTIGSIFGTFITGFFLIPHFRVTYVLFMDGILLLVIATYLSKKKRNLKIIDSLFIITLVSFQVFSFPPGNGAALPLNSTIIADRESTYSTILIYDQHIPDRNDTLRSFQIGSLIQGGRWLSSGESLYEYIELIPFAWVYKPDISNVLFLGNGAGIGVNLLREKYPDIKITVVDIDPLVFDMAIEFFNQTQYDGISYEVGDARYFLKNTDKKFDLIVMDVFGGTHQIPPHLATLEMNELVKTRLTDDGVYFQNIVSSMEGEKSRLFKSFIITLGETFPVNRAIKIADRNEDQQTIVIFSSEEKPGSLDVNDFVESNNFRNKTRSKTLIEEYLLVDGGYNTSGGILLTDEYSPTDTMF